MIGIHRRSFASGLATAALAPFCPCCVAASRPKRGCMLRAAAARDAERPVLVSSSGSKEIDGLCFGEVDRLNRSFEVSAAFGFYDDSRGANALAVDSIYDRTRKDGAVLMGRSLVMLLAAGDAQANMLPILAVLAHEWGHIRQYKSRVVADWGVHFELSADFLAGWYLSYQEKVTDAGMARVVGEFARLGDTGFTREDHHGTPAQRSRMLAFAFNGLQSPDFTPGTERPSAIPQPAAGEAVEAMETSLHLQQ